MSIYSVNMSNIQRSSGENALKSAAYISGTKLTLMTLDPLTGEEKKQTWDFRSKAGVAYSKILAPDGSPDWVFDREELWNRAESFEIGDDAQAGNRLMIALPRELTQEQNIDLAREFTLEYLVNHGMVVDLNIHYDNEHNPHLHLQMTTRNLVTDSDGNTSFSPSKNRKWVQKFFLHYLREGAATVINHHLERYGHLDRVSHLSHKARGIELTPGIHEGAARHMSAAERRLLNEAILAKNAAAIRDNPELVFQKLSINKPVFTKDDIATVLSDALYRDMEIESGTEDTRDNNNDSLSTESLHTRYASEFILAYDSLLKSPEVRLVNPCDLRGRTLYALTKRLELEERFVETVEELGASRSHGIDISVAEVGTLSVLELLGSKVKQATHVISKAVLGTAKDKMGIDIDLSSILPKAYPHTFTLEQKAAVVSIVNGLDISLLEGFPGSGKTATMREIVRLYKKAGYNVIGTATSASAAEVLGMEAGIESKNITRLRKEWQLAKNSRFGLEPALEFELAFRADYYKEDQYRKFGTALTNKDVLIIDEASMVELANMDYLLSEVKASGAKAILIGDNNQLAAIGMTGAFKKASQIVGSAKLTAVMRHKSRNVERQRLYREATQLMGEYRINRALEIYDTLGTFKVSKTVDDTKEALVRDYINNYTELARILAKDDLSATKSLVIGTYTNTSVNYFNIEVRKQLKQAGVLKGREQVFRSGNETVELVKGEQIVFLENRPEFQRYFGVLNGEVGTVLEFIERPDKLGGGIFRLLVHKSDGSKRIVMMNTKVSKYNKYPPRFKHGYAVTGYKLQGDTAGNMMVYFEAVMGYEAFNVLMSRHKESVLLYLAQEMLEDIVYQRMNGSSSGDSSGNSNHGTEDYIKELKEHYEIVSYKRIGVYGEKKYVPAWFIGLAIAASKRVENSFSSDYIDPGLLSGNEEVIKSYLESRELVFALRAKLDNWKTRESRPTKLARLHKAIYKMSKHYREQCDKAGNGTMQKLTINPGKLIDAYRRLDDEIKADKALLKTELESTPDIDLLIFANISRFAREELKTLSGELDNAKIRLTKQAKLICDNYHRSIDSSQLEGAHKDRITMGDRLTQLNLNYEPIQRHAGYSSYRYYLEEIKLGATLMSNPCFINIIKTLETINNSNHDMYSRHDIKAAGNEQEKTITDLQVNLKELKEFISDTRLYLLETKEEILKTELKQKGLDDEIKKATTHTTKLFPEYLSRVYKESPNEVIAKWNELKKEYKEYKEYSDNISAISHRVYSNPKLLGNLKGIGLSNVFGITGKRQSAITNLEVISKRLKDFELARSKIKELKVVLYSDDYQKELELKGEKEQQVRHLEQLLPKQSEEKVLDELADILSSYNKPGSKSEVMIEEVVTGSLSSPLSSSLPLYNSLKTLSAEEETQNLIYEYYNYIGKVYGREDYEKELTQAPRSEENSKENIEQENIERVSKEDNKSNIGRTKQNQPRQAGKQQAGKQQSLTWEKVDSHLTPSHYEQIFRELAAEINPDSPKITKSGDWLNCGSLGMNTKNGLWKRLSTGEKGNIYSFISAARGFSKRQALEFVASVAGCHNEYGDGKYEHDNSFKAINDKINNKVSSGDSSLKQDRTNAQTHSPANPPTNPPTNLPTNEWIAYSTIPQDTRAMNPKSDFPWMLKEHRIESTYTYRNKEGELLGGTMRLINKATNEKRVMPYAYCKNEATNTSKWQFKVFTDHGYKPIYKLENLNHDKRTILIVEGEKTADSTQALLPEYSVMSWLGGSSSVDKVNWSQLRGRSVVIFPDNDKPGKDAALKILSHINIANDKIGYASIVDLDTISSNKDRNKARDTAQDQSQSQQQTKTHTHPHNPFPEKWDLADKLPEGVTLRDIKYAIEQSKERSRTPFSNSNLGQLGDKAPESESTIELLLSQYKYLEARGIISYSHEFLKPEHGLYRDTVTYLIPQIKQDQLTITTPQNEAKQVDTDPAKGRASERSFITALENKYDELISKCSSSGIGYLEHYDSIHQKHETALAGKGQDRAELYKTMVRDITLLHSLELSKSSGDNTDYHSSLPKLTKTHHEIIAKTAYEAIHSYNYKRPFSKRMQSNNLATQEKITIAETIHSITTDPCFRKNLIESQTIEPTITRGILRRDVGLAFDRIVHVGIPQQLHQIQLIDQAKQLTVHAEDVETIRQMALKEALELWLINNKQSLPESNYELSIHRAIFELKATNILNNSSDLTIAQIAGQPTPNNPYSKIIAAIISHEEIYLNNEGQIINSTNRLATVIDKRDLTLRANHILEARNNKLSKLKETLKQQSSLILRAESYTNINRENKSEDTINRILAEHITDHEMTYGKGNITTEKLTSMHEIAKHEAKLEVAIMQEWNEQEINTQEAQKTQKVHNAKATSKGLPKKQIAHSFDINTSISVARHRMRQEMNEAAHPHDHQHVHQHHNHHDYRNQNQHTALHHHMDAHQASLNQIAADHHSYIYDYIAQVKTTHLQQEQAHREQQQERQRQMHHERVADMGR